MISVAEARQIVRQLKFENRVKSTNLKNALGYVLAEDLTSPIQMPPFNQSAMDGYALRLHQKPSYRLIGEVQAGSAENPVMQRGEAVRIFTGAAVPDDAEAVIMQEKTKVEGLTLIINEIIKAGKNIRPAGEQIREGQIAMNSGVRLGPAAIGFLAGLGIEKVNIYQKPNISVVATGSELVAPGKLLNRGQIYESNAIMLQNVLEENGFETEEVMQIADDYESTLEVFDRLIGSNDFLIISGGISVGDYDFAGKALQELEVNTLFYKVRQKPGKPMFLGQKGGCTIFALPGNPAAALSCFYQYVLTALKQFSGETTFSLPKLSLPLKHEYHKKGNRAHFLKARIEDGQALILSKQSSAMLHSFATADAMIYIPEDQSYTAAGELVEVSLLPFGKCHLLER